MKNLLIEYQFPSIDFVLFIFVFMSLRAIVLILKEIDKQTFSLRRILMNLSRNRLLCIQYAYSVYYSNPHLLRFLSLFGRFVGECLDVIANIRDRLSNNLPVLNLQNCNCFWMQKKSFFLWENEWKNWSYGSSEIGRSCEILDPCQMESVHSTEDPRWDFVLRIMNWLFWSCLCFFLRLPSDEATNSSILTSTAILTWALSQLSTGAFGLPSLWKYEVSFSLEKKFVSSPALPDHV